MNLCKNSDQTLFSSALTLMHEIPGLIPFTSGFLKCIIFKDFLEYMIIVFLTILSSTANATLQIINHNYFNIKYKCIKVDNNIVKSIEQVISKKNRGKNINIHDFTICLAQGWFSKLKKSVSSVSTVRVYHCTAKISHGSDIPKNDVVWEIVPLLILKQRCLKLWKVCKLIRARTHTSVQLVPDVLNWRKIWRHRWPFHHIHVVCRQELRCGTCGMGASIILLQYCHTITCLHERQNHWGKNVVSVFLDIRGINYSHKLSFSIVRNSTPYHHRTAPKTICLNNACNALLYGGNHAFVHQHVPEINATHLFTDSVATELRSSTDDSSTRSDVLVDGVALALVQRMGGVAVFLVP